MSKDTSEKKHDMKTRKDIKIEDDDINYTKEFDIDKEDDTNSVTLTETTEETTEDTLDDISVSDCSSEKNSDSDIDNEETKIDNEEINDKFLKRKFSDILNSDNTIIIVNNNAKKSKKIFNGLVDELGDDEEAEVIDEEYEDDEDDEDDPNYLNNYEEEDPYISIKEDFEKEIKKATELIKKNEDVIKDNPNFKNYSRQDVEYFLNLNKKKKTEIIKIEKETNNTNKEEIPLRFKILNSNISNQIKSIAIKKLNLLNSMNERSGEYFKILTYVENLCKIPCGIHKTLEVSNKNEPNQIANFLKKSYDILNTNVYGHKNSKEQIIRIIAQWVSNPSLKGNCIGIHGSPGVGKTKLIKDGLCKALDLPFVFIPLGGVNDSSYLTGHSFTYEGAIHGKIVDSLMKANCMNPIIYFDELDKISDTSRGQEIINTLIHLTDSTQNDSFFDKYFYDIPLDLSKSLIVFTYNNDDFINPILKDRMIRISTEDYSIKDKVNISKEFLIPELCKDFNFNNDDLVFNDDIIKYIVSRTDKENGVRNLKRSLECIISNINLYRLVNFNNSSNKTTRNNIKKDEFSVNKLEIQYNTPFLVDNYIVDNLIQKKINPLSDSIAHIYI
jgi:ATP-dependent Lon protease